MGIIVRKESDTRYAYEAKNGSELEAAWINGDYNPNIQNVQWHEQFDAESKLEYLGICAPSDMTPGWPTWRVKE